MAKVDLKTKETGHSVEDYIAGIPDEEVRRDCRELITLMGRMIQAPPKLWGGSIIGFGNTTLTYASGRELDWMQCGFSPRKGKLSLYLTCDPAHHGELLAKLGKHSTGKSCLYIKRLADVDRKVLEKLVAAGMEK